MSAVAGIIGDVAPLAWGGALVQCVEGHFDAASPGVGAQFLEGAENYDEKYFHPEAVAKAIAGVLATAGLDPNPRHILDLGSGSGNSVIALAKRWPQATILATDISPAMVALLNRRIALYGLGDRVSAVVMDASRADLSAGAFDMIVGSSMLHHLHEPFEVVDRLIASLAPGGAALFFEPFQSGNFFVRQAMLEILRANETAREKLPADTCKRILMLVDGIDVVSSSPRIDPRLPNLDDKWLFTKAQFEAAARHAGVSVTIRTSNRLENAFHDRVTALVGLKPLPPWADAIARSYDANVSHSLREDLLMEGSIVFAKSETRLPA